MMDRKADRVLSIALSIIVHLAIVGALVWGWFQYRQPKPTPQSLAIEGTVVNNQAQTTPIPSPPKPAEPPPAPAPPPPDARQQAEQQAQEQQRKAQEQAAAQQAAEQRQREEQAKAAAEKVAAEKAAAEKAAVEKAAAEKTAAEKAAADKAAADKAEADRKAEEARKQEAARKAQELQKQQAEQDRARREADLKAQLAAEEHENAVQSGPARAEYLSLITARINHAWIRPPSARSGVRCTVHITQVPGGVVTHVSVTGCNGDESVRQSVETAAYRASPLPAPSDPALFDPNIDVTFAPDE